MGDVQFDEEGGEGDTLVVDTIGFNDRTFVDNYRTPHTARMHVVERFRFINDGKVLEDEITVEDPGAFTTTWRAMQRYRRVEQGPLTENVCAENPNEYYKDRWIGLPQSDKRDF